MPLAFIRLRLQMELRLVARLVTALLASLFWGNACALFGQVFDSRPWPAEPRLDRHGDATFAGSVIGGPRSMWLDDQPRRLPPIDGPVSMLPPVGSHWDRWMVDDPVMERSFLLDGWFDRQKLDRGLTTLVSDAANFYSYQNLRDITLCLGLGAALAHTDVDQQVRDWWQDDVRSDYSDTPADVAKIYGEHGYLVALVGAAYLAGEFAGDTDVGANLGEWSTLTGRSLIVGTPSILLLQSALGASRPGETSQGAAWKPFADVNGVSGHAYIGAIPFLTAARMTEDRYLRAMLYASSTLTAISRINDDSHYVSQTIIGWWIAHAACRSLEDSGGPPRRWHLAPLTTPDAAGIGVVIQN